ncbi:MAG: glycosyltransferase family 2 protein [Chloroflexi bacterium]|nr:glycosyltransferase family 2 protein [Chloroflexota bacterium]
MDSLQPSVTVLTVNWNRKEMTLDLLKRLSEMDYPGLRVVLVENGSADGSAEAVAERFPEVEMLKTGENLGSAGGFRTGFDYILKEHGSKYIWLLDSDVTVREGALRALVEAAEKNPDAAQVGPAVLNADFPDIVFETGAKVDWDNVTSAPMEKGMRDTGERRTYRVDYLPQGCGALYRAEALKGRSEMGVFVKHDPVEPTDPVFFYMWEDIDMGWRHRKAGWDIIATSSAKMEHRDMTVLRGSPLQRYYSTRNSLIFFFRHGDRRIKNKAAFRAYMASNLFDIWGFEGYRKAAEQGIEDFKEGRWGRQDHKFPPPHNLPGAGIEEVRKACYGRILYFPESAKDIKRMEDILGIALPSEKCDMAGEEYLKNQFSGRMFFGHGLSQKEVVAMAGKLRRHRYTAVLTSRAFFSPLIGLLNRDRPVFILNPDNTFSLKNRDAMVELKYAWSYLKCKFAAGILAGSSPSMK